MALAADQHLRALLRRIGDVLFDLLDGAGRRSADLE